MEYATEIVNISKIEDGFFIGDKYCATNIDVIIQFKITHIINTSGTQVLNQFESLGVKYFSLNWIESPNQTLFDNKDEIPNKIISFIEESFTKGEGLLVHSVKGVNRALIIVILYFMKKFAWSLKKCLELIDIKVKNVKIKKYFLKQLESYEKKIKRKMSKEWYNVNSINSDEEMMIRNTYLNSLIKSQNKNIIHKNGNINKQQYKSHLKKHVIWGNINYENKDDLLLKKQIKDIDVHILLKPLKKCIKTDISVKEETELENVNEYINNNLHKYMSNNIVNENTDINDKTNEKTLINLGLNMKIVDKINQINNNFNNLNMPKQRPNSAEKNNAIINIDKTNTKINNKYDFDKLSNYFDKLERKEKEKIVQNKNYKKIILKPSNKYNQNIKTNNINNLKGRRCSSYDKNKNNNINNNKKGIININRQYIYPNKIINNSININMINYISNNSTQEMPSFNKNFFMNKINDSFNINNNSYDPYNFFNKEEETDIAAQQSFNQFKEKIKQKNLENKMNNSANNFYNFSTLKNKEIINNDYYNVMGQSFNLNSNKVKNVNKKVSIFLRNNKNINNNENMDNNSLTYKNNKEDNNNIRTNTKKLKRVSTPNNLLPQKNNFSRSKDNNERNKEINYLNYSNAKLDDSNLNNNNDLSFNSRSFVINPKNPCKYISILKYFFILYSP